MADRGAVGGIVWDDGEAVNVNFQHYEQMQGVLVDGNYTELFTAPYAGNAATSWTFADDAQIWPVVADVNGDGLWDLIVMSATTTNVFVNVGSKGNPKFRDDGALGDRALPSVGADDPGGPLVDLDMNSTAKFASMALDVKPTGALSATTNGATLLVSDDEGRIWYYTTQSNNPTIQQSNNSFTLQHKVWGGSFAGFAEGLMLAAVDWEDDGDLDCICGTAEGKLMLLRDPKVGRPTGLTAEAGVDNVLLSWDPNGNSRVCGYKVYRAVGDSGDYGVRGAPALPTYRDTGLAAGIYGYKVSAVSRFYTAGNSTPMESESLAASGVRDLTISNAVKTSGAIVWVTEAAVLAVSATTDEGESMDIAAQGKVRSNLRLAYEALQDKTDDASLALRQAYEGAKRVRISGPKDMVSTIADMGISPMFAPAMDETGTLQLTYAKPTLEITAFDPSTGEVRFKVIPGEGNEIVSKMATSCLHVYGTDNLNDPMRFVSAVDVDLTPYLNSETKGEGVATVDLGTHTFLKVKVESESKVDGAVEQ